MPTPEQVFRFFRKRIPVSKVDGDGQGGFVLFTASDPELVARIWAGTTEGAILTVQMPPEPEMPTVMPGVVWDESTEVESVFVSVTDEIPQPSDEPKEDNRFRNLIRWLRRWL